ncbi:hypothetical protein QTO34_009912 [Cnephaeus nilssonii]|uniref:Ig-like domain-containing protein n=1 Tax=Cnephaeus nilssonii TaxID=3371016 RepID=A0AA40LFB9_CNENI|nr:hypothetical protein QTO34_009912 [Eptesicus nilssonii]
MEPEILLCFLPGALPKPSLRAQPGPVIPRGRPVTFVCRGPAGAYAFFLEKDGRPVPPYKIRASQGSMKGTEARFHFPAVSEDTAGSYRCLYEQVHHGWSERSEPLRLQVTDPASRDYTVENSIRLGLAGVVLLILVAILVEAGFSQHTGPCPSPPSGPSQALDPPGTPVTFVCRGPAGAEFFYLWKDGSAIPLGIKPGYPDGTQGLEASFLIPAVLEGTAGSYRCSYYHVSRMSERSEPAAADDRGGCPSSSSGGSRAPHPVPPRLCPRAPCPPAHPQPWGSPPSAHRTLGLHPWLRALSLVPSGHHGGLDPELRLSGDTELSLLGWVGPDLPATRGPAQALPQGRARPVILRGRPVTFVCSSLVWTLQFRLEKDGSPVPLGIKPGSQDGTQGLEARFLIPAVREDTAGRYHCLYAHVYGWSERSEPLQLQVTERMSPLRPQAPASRDYTVENSIRLGLAGWSC